MARGRADSSASRASGGASSHRKRSRSVSTRADAGKPLKRERSGSSSSASAAAATSIPLARLRPRLLAMLRKLNDSKSNPRGLFSTPVDTAASRLPGYNAVVAHPMDIGTVKTLLEDGGYSTLGEVMRDLRLTFANALRYHDEDSSVYELAGKMEVELESHVVALNEAVAQQVREEEAHSCDHCRGRRCAHPECRAKCLHFKRAELYCSPAPRGCGRRIAPNAQYVRTSRFGLYWCHQCYGRMSETIDVAVDAPTKPHSGERTAAFLRPPPPPKLILKSSLSQHVHNEVFKEPFVTCAACDDPYHVVCAGHVPRRIVEDGAGHCLRSGGRSTAIDAEAEGPSGSEGEEYGAAALEGLGAARRRGKAALAGGAGDGASSSDTVLGSNDFVCPQCVAIGRGRGGGAGSAAGGWDSNNATPTSRGEIESEIRSGSASATASFASGSGSGGGGAPAPPIRPEYDASALPQTDLGQFMEKHLHKRMREQAAALGVERASMPQTFVRIVSCAKHAGTVPGRLGLWRRLIEPSVASACVCLSPLLALRSPARSRSLVRHRCALTLAAFDAPPSPPPRLPLDAPTSLAPSPRRSAGTRTALESSLSLIASKARNARGKANAKRTTCW